MKIENEIEKLVKRVTLLETQNIRFKSLLDSALEVTKHSISGTNIQNDESEFLQQTIKLIEDEKQRMQEDMNLISSSENDSLVFNVKHLESDTLELQKKVDVLVNHTQKQSKEIDQLKTELAEIKFLIIQPNSNSHLLKNILLLDNAVADNANASLVHERYKLQKKIVTLERKKTELMIAIEDMNSNVKRKGMATIFKNKLEKALFKAIDDVANREYENLHVKVLDLEKEREKLLNELQNVLDSSRKEIANEYCKLQKKILEIETEKAELQLTLKTLDKTEEMLEINNFSHTSIPNADEENIKIENILQAFSNKPIRTDYCLTNLEHNNVSLYNHYIRVGLPTCDIL